MARLSSKELVDRVYHANLVELLKSNKAFQRFLFTLVENAGIYAYSFTAGDTHSTSFREGRRSLGLEVMRDLTALEPNALAFITHIGPLLKEGLTSHPLLNGEHATSPDHDPNDGLPGDEPDGDGGLQPG